MSLWEKVLIGGSITFLVGWMVWEMVVYNWERKWGGESEDE